jgi:hypothetical protein
MIMVALVAAATSGNTPISSIRGPFTMPPPTPNMPAGTTTGVTGLLHVGNSASRDCQMTVQEII